MTRKRQAAAVLLAAGAALLLVGLLLWKAASDEQAEDRLTARYAQAILLDQGDDEAAAEVDVEPDAERGPAIAALALGLLAAGGGAVLRARD